MRTIKYFFLALLITSCSKNDDSPNYGVDPAGFVDESFGNGGLSLVDFGSQAYARAAVIQPDGKLLIAGEANLSNAIQGIYGGIALARINSDGTPDNTFSYDGKVTTSVPLNVATSTTPYATGSCNFVGVLPNGKIIAGGNFTAVLGTGLPAKPSLTIAKYNSDGSLDFSFGTNGILIDPIETTGTYVSSAGKSIHMQSDGKFIIGGFSVATINGANVLSLAMVRYNEDGSRDTTYGTNGLVLNTLASGFGSSTNMNTANLTVISDVERLVVAINAPLDNGTTVKNIFRFTNNGVVDGAFGNGGSINFTNALETTNGNLSVLKQKNSNYLISGSKKVDLVGSAVRNNFFANSYTNNGLNDTAFGNSGEFTTTFGSTSSDWIDDSVVQPNGKIILSGLTYDETYNNYDNALCRLNKDGSIDKSFGNEGKVTYQSTAGALFYNLLLIDSENRIYVIGFTGINSVFGIIRII